MVRRKGENVRSSHTGRQRTVMQGLGQEERGEVEEMVEAETGTINTKMITTVLQITWRVMAKKSRRRRRSSSMKTYLQCLKHHRKVPKRKQSGGGAAM